LKLFRPIRRRAFGTALLNRSLTLLARQARAFKRALKPAVSRPHRSPAVAGKGWTQGVASGAAGSRRYWLYCPPGVAAQERLPLMVMLHGCRQDAAAFAASTGMNRVALRERFLVLYPEQDLSANAQGCWNWFETDSGRGFGEAELILGAIDQVCARQPVDPQRVAISGLSAGASMAALLVTRHPARFQALVMHSGIPPGTAHSTMSALGAMQHHHATRPLAVTSAVMAASWPALLVIHGQADRVVSPRYGQASADLWAAAAGASPAAARRLQRGRRHAMSITDFKHVGRTVATLVAVDKLGHAWSGGADRQPFADAAGPDASRMAWSFAAKQFLP
jgi:poly(hydroxyalkanoate) depolymerase family esterase